MASLALGNRDSSSRILRIPNGRFFWGGENNKFLERKEGKGRRRYRFNEIDAFVVVRKGNVAPHNSFLAILCLFDHKDVLIEMLLQFLICIINTQLFEAVYLL